MCVSLVQELRGSGTVRDIYYCGVTETFPKTVMVENLSLLSAITEKHPGNVSKRSRGPYSAAWPDFYSKVHFSLVDSKSSMICDWILLPNKVIVFKTLPSNFLL